MVRTTELLKRIADAKELREMRRGERGIQVGDMIALGRAGADYLRAVAREIEAAIPPPADSPLSQVARAMTEFGDVARVTAEAMNNPSSPGRFDDEEAPEAIREIDEAIDRLKGLRRTIEAQK